MLGDTWLYADRDWTSQKSWWSRPAPRCGHALAYDATVGTAVLFGGIGKNNRTLADTWLFDGSSWQQIHGVGPPGRRYAAFAYDPSLQGCVLHGGAADDAGHYQFGDSWLFHNRTWTPFPAEFETNVRDDHALAYHNGARTLILLGGLGSDQEILAATSHGWQRVMCEPLHPRHQCSPLVWANHLDGLILHGGETGHGGGQFDTTRLLQLLPANGTTTSY
jgi:hypothetical protein